MKTFYTLLVALSLMNGAMAQWVLQNSGTTKTLNSVYFTDVITGYAVGDSGIILKTTDGGVTWIAQNSGITDDLYSIHFPKPDTGYAVGGNSYPSSSIILKTTNGGTNWTVQTSGISDKINSVYFIDADTGYAVGKNGTGSDSRSVIIKTTNGGFQWSIILTTPTQRYTLNSICFPDAGKGYAIGTFSWITTYGFLYSTNDFGSTWLLKSNIYQEMDNYLASLFFINADTGYAVGYEIGWGNIGLILKTINGGTDWTLSWAAINEVGQFNSSYFTDASTGYVVGNEGTIHQTSDGGSTWNNQSSGIYIALHSVYFPGKDTGYIVGDSGTIITTINGGVGINYHNQNARTLTTYPNPVSTEITIETPTNGNLSILNTSGQQLLQREITEPTTTIDVSGWKSGVYFVKVAGENGVQVGKFIKQ
jgi:photosystem II stability/assembly factor-like uncharacterized protein